MPKAVLEPWVPRLLTRLPFGKAPVGGKRYRRGEEEEKTRPARQASLSVQEGGESRDVYDCLLTQAEIQGNINHVNGERRGLGALSG